MPKCIDQDFPCQDPQYKEFDDAATQDLRAPPLALQIVSASSFCTSVPIAKALQLDDLTHNDYLKGLRSKVGLYHLWVEHDNCDDHETHTMRCVYVGKGFAEARINDHIKEKFRDKESLNVSFYECSNRISKYLEQLFLDTYHFELNCNENHGIETLFAVWNEHRYSMGTEIQAVSESSKLATLDDV